MNLEQALQQIADRLNLDADELIAYAAEDEVGGWDYWDENTNGPPERPFWPIGSIFSAEGKVLYAIARAIGAQNVLEMGTHYGCSATHLLEALDKENGELFSWDDHSDSTALEIGILIPDELRVRLTVARGSLSEVATAPLNPRLFEEGTLFDLIFEDTDHSPETVKLAWEFAQKFLRPGGIMVSHDAAHFLVGVNVQLGIRRAGVSDHLTIQIDGTDCGLAIWQKPGVPELEQEPGDGDFGGRSPDEPLPADEEHEPVESELLAEGDPMYAPDTQPDDLYEFTVPTREALDALTVDQLTDLAKEQGVPIKSSMRKLEIVEVLVQAELKRHEVPSSDTE